MNKVIIDKKGPVKTVWMNRPEKRNALDSELLAEMIEALRAPVAADEGDRSRPILCRWVVPSHNMRPVRSSCGVEVLPTSELDDPRNHDYVVVVGGLGQIKGTVIAAFALGILNSFIEYSTTASLAKVIVFVIIVIFLQVRPQGLFTVRTRSLV